MKKGEIFWQETISEINKELETIAKLKAEIEKVSEQNAMVNNRR